MGSEFFLATIALVAVCIASYTDLRKRIISNWLTFPLIGVGVAFYALLGLHQEEIWVAISGVLGAAIAFVIGYVMWVAGGWAGGDVKLFTALGALLYGYTAPTIQAPYPFPLTILLNSVIAILPALLVYTAICHLRGRSAFFEHAKITELKEGMIPAETIYEKDGKIGRWSSRFGLKPRWDRVYTNPSRAAGVTRYQVGVLRRLVRERKLKNYIKIKKGIPFASVLGLGVVISIFYGDLYWCFLLALIGA